MGIQKVKKKVAREFTLDLGVLAMPDWYREMRDHQVDAIEEIVDAFERGSKVVFLDAPTGSGKTLIAEAVRRVMKVKAVYVCSGKQLQDQFAGDYPYAKVLKGRSNYPTEHMPWPMYSAGDCAMTDECGWCEHKSSCPYEKAKTEALRAEVGVVNTSYFLTECNMLGAKSKLSGSEFVIADECDVMESALMGVVEFSVGEKVLDRLRIDAPRKGVHKPTIIEWIEMELLPAVDVRLQQLRGAGDDVEMVREVQRLRRLGDSATRVVMKLHDDPDNFVRDNDAGPLVLRPVKVDDYGRQYLWRHGKQWLCMSATIISAEEMAASLGLEEGEWEVVEVPMTFPKENRRVKLVPVASMTRKNIEADKGYLLSAINKILLENKDENVLVHTVNYALTGWLFDELNKQHEGVLAYRNSNERDHALNLFIGRGGAGKGGPRSVLLAPSLDRGIDLPGELCRVQIIAKVPFPSLGDKQVSTRMHMPMGQTWYNVQTVRTLVQMTGRAVRSEDDWAVTYVLDKEFMRFWDKGRRLLPGWWVDAVEVESVRGWIGG